MPFSWKTDSEIQIHRSATMQVVRWVFSAQLTIRIRDFGSTVQFYSKYLLFSTTVLNISNLKHFEVPDNNRRSFFF